MQLSAPLGSTIDFVWLRLTTNIATTGMRGAAGGRQPAVAKFPRM